MGEEDHPEIEKCLKVFGDIHYEGKRAMLEEDIDPAKFLPSKLQAITREN